jgi:hypothetical protein
MEPMKNYRLSPAFTIDRFSQEQPNAVGRDA